MEMLILTILLLLTPTRGMRDPELWKTLTRELYGKTRLADVKISLKLDGDDV